MDAAIYIETAGCAFNVADGEAMAGQLAHAGYRIESNPDDADLVILNTCTVKNRTFLNFRKRLDGLRGRNARVVVAGCIPPAYATSGLLDSVSTLDPDSVDRVGEVVRDTLAGRVVHARSREALISRPTLPTLRRNAVVEILPIARGCLSACAFCQTRISRGRLVSFPADSIVERARRAFGEGVRELWVTGQDTGTWGRDIGSSLPELLERILQLPGDFRVRLGMTSPQWVTPRLAEYLDLFDHPKMFRFFHVPVQSGSDSVLRTMKREGGVADFEAIHRAFARRHPEGTFLTDLIAGFPGETEEDFEATIALVDRLALPGINVSRFSARPGTAAAKMRPLPSAVVSRRTKALVSRVREIAADYHRRRVGRRYRVLIDEHDRRGHSLGRTESYRPVMLDGRLTLGEWVEVEIVRGENFSFFGRRFGAEAA
jgi:threonylcarbamoyladenosine tRNA methylthiotransferase CDKAL1